MTNNVLKPIHANAGIEAEYRRRLKKIIKQMHASVVYWLRAKYRAELPDIAQDSAAEELQDELDKLVNQWQPQFDLAAEKLAGWFAQKTKNYADGTLQRILRETGISVRFEMTPEIQDIYQAVIHEQVGLIKSIGHHHLDEVQGLVMRSVQSGRDLGWLSKELTKRYGITNRRAVLISRDQNNKATAVITRARHQQLGVTKAVWKHSHAGKHPRPSHLKADGHEYDIDKGMYLDGEWLLPGEAINCRCVAQPVIPGFDY